MKLTKETKCNCSCFVPSQLKLFDVLYYRRVYYGFVQRQLVTILTRKMSKIMLPVTWHCYETIMIKHRDKPIRHTRSVKYMLCDVFWSGIASKRKGDLSFKPHRNYSCQMSFHLCTSIG